MGKTKDISELKKEYIDKIFNQLTILVVIPKYNKSPYT